MVSGPVRSGPSGSGRAASGCSCPVVSGPVRPVQPPQHWAWASANACRMEVAPSRVATSGRTPVRSGELFITVATLVRIGGFRL